MKKFTLIELLVVISIIGVLASILLPVVAGSRQKTMELKAKTDVTNLMSAISKYESAYGKLPIIMETDGKNVMSGFFVNSGKYKDSGERGRVSIEGYDVLTQSLSGVDIVKGTIIDGAEITFPLISDTTETKSEYKCFRALNPRKTPFLDVPNDFPKTGFVDPWGRRYVIIMDYEDSSLTTSDSKTYAGTKIRYAPYDKRIEHPAIALNGWNDSNATTKLGSIDSPTTVNTFVAVYCIGPNGVDDGGLGRNFAEACDDINSWSAL